MAKLPLRFLLAVAIPVAVAVGQSSASAEVVASLIEASKEEIAYESHIEGFASYAQKDWKEYSFTIHTIDSYIDLAKSGEPPPTSEWALALKEVGEARNTLCKNAEAELTRRIKERAAQLEADKRDLAAALAAVKDVAEAEQVAKDAEHRAKWLEGMKKISEVVEVIGNPYEVLEAGSAINHLIHIALAASTYKADFESFIQAEAQYWVQVTLARHGFASIGELNRRVTTASGNIAKAAEDLRTLVHARDEERKYSAPALYAKP